MAEERKKVSPWLVVGIGAGIATAAVVGIYALAQAAPPAPPAEYCCPYCSACFSTYEELVAHVTTEHPGERLPVVVVWT